MSRPADTEAYKNLMLEFQRILYIRDPEGIGASIGAPLDEYSDSAARLASALRSVDELTGVRSVVTHMFPSAEEGLSSEIWEAVQNFRSRRS